MTSRYRAILCVSVVLLAACGPNPHETRAAATMAVLRLPAGIRSDSVFRLMTGTAVTQDQSATTDKGRLRVVQWENGLRVVFRNDELNTASVADLTK
jgi:hypothetical protein